MSFSSPWARACDNHEVVDLTVGRPVLDHAEENPDELVAALDNKTEAVTREIDTLRYPNLSYAFPPHSHSIVPGGLLVISYVTRLIPRTSFTIRFATRVKNAMSNGYTSAVIPSLLVTARSAQALS
jgi:hypothetical protein